MKKRRDLYSPALHTLDAYNEPNSERVQSLDIALEYVGDLSGYVNAVDDANSPYDTSALFSNGEVYIGENNFPINIAIELLVQPTTSGSIFSIQTGGSVDFDVFYDTVASSISIIRYKNQPNQDIFVFTVPDLTTQFNHVCINRRLASLEVCVDGVLVGSVDSYYYPVPTGSMYVKNYTGYFKYALIKAIPYTSATISNLSNVNTLIPLQPAPTSPSRLLFDIEYTDKANLLTIFPLDKIALTYSDAYTIGPSASLSNIYSTLQGMATASSSGAVFPREYTIELLFQLEGSDDVSVIYSSYPEWYIYTIDKNQLALNYYEADVLTTLILGSIEFDSSISLVISFSDTVTKFSVNNNTIVTLNKYLRSDYPLYRFNYNRPGLLNVDTYVKLKLFRGWNYDKLNQPYVLLDSTIQPSTYPFINTKYKYKDATATTNVLLDDGIELTTSATTILSGQSYTFTLTRLTALYPDTVYLSYSITGTDYTNVLLFDSAESSQDFTVVVDDLDAYDTTTEFTIYAKTNINQTSITLPYLSSVVLSDDPLLLTSMVDGYLLDAGPITSLKGLGSPTTNAAKVYYDNYGYSLYLSQSDDVTLPAQLTNVNTVVLLYKEQVLAPYRAYIGDPVAYSFNGGQNGEIIGPLQVDSSSYIEALSVSGSFDEVKLAENGNVFVATELDNNRLLVYTKTNNSWQVSPVELSLNLQAPDEIASASLDINSVGNIIAAGFRNANQGEGVVKIWKLTQGSWVEDLHISSPVAQPVPGNYGHSVAINDTGTTLAVSELNSATVYIYTKGSSWNSTPDQSIVGSGTFGYDIALSSDAIYLFISNSTVQDTKIYQYGVSYSLMQSIPYGYELYLDKTTNDLALSNFIDSNELKIYRYNGVDSWADLQTFSGSGTYGSSFSLSQGSLLVGDISSNEITLYVESQAWASTTAFTKNVSAYGIVVDIADDIIIFSDAETLLDLYTSDQNILQAPVEVIRSNGELVTPADILYNSDINILFLQSSNNLTISSIGSNRAGGYLDGMFLGALFYNSLLSTQQMTNIEKYIKRRLAILENSIL